MEKHLESKKCESAEYKCDHCETDFNMKEFTENHLMVTPGGRRVCPNMYDEICKEEEEKQS